MRSMRFVFFLPFALVAIVIASCSSSDSADGESCTAGQQVKCACSGSSQGFQICKDDGSGFGACMGCGLSGTGGWPGSDSGLGGAPSGGAESGGNAGAGGGPRAGGESPETRPPR